MKKMDILKRFQQYLVLCTFKSRQCGSHLAFGSKAVCANMQVWKIGSLWFTNECLNVVTLFESC